MSKCYYFVDAFNTSYAKCDWVKITGERKALGAYISSLMGSGAWIVDSSWPDGENVTMVLVPRRELSV